MSDNIIKNKSFNFALRVVKVYQFLNLEKKNIIEINKILASIIITTKQKIGKK